MIRSLDQMVDLDWKGLSCLVEVFNYSSRPSGGGIGALSVSGSG